MPLFVNTSGSVDAMTTVNGVISDVRVLLNDSDGSRYTTAQLMRILNQGLAEAWRIRPDLFVSSPGSNFEERIAGDNTTLPAEYANALIDYIVGRAELRDDEFAADGRAMALLNSFRTRLLGV